MRWNQISCLAVLGAAWLSGCGPAGSSSLDDVSANGGERQLAADIRFLASDDLEGRGTPSPGLRTAARYLESRLGAQGVEPVIGPSFLQPYTVGEYAPADADVQIRIAGRLIPPEDYVFINIGRDPESGPLSLPLVYTGHGVVAEERNVDQLSELDLEGAAAVAVKGAPWTLDPAQVFGPDRAIGKVMAATVRGAQMLVYLSSELDQGEGAEAGFFRQMRHASVGFIREDGVGPASALNPILVIRPAAFRRALGKKGEQISRGPLRAEIEITIQAEVREGQAANVLGKITGTDPVLRDEWVVLSAHYDHLGSHPVPAGQDGIWNGADDNASGTAAVLELAGRIARRPSRRSVLVLFVSGEERGILGSAYYASRPPIPMDRVVAQLNLDMVGRSEGAVQAIADTSPLLFEKTVEIGRRHGVQVIADRQPAWRLLYLTDTYHFARAGVPSVHFFTGFHTDYHQPSDTVDKIRHAELARIVDVIGELARACADSSERPRFSRPAWFRTP